MEYLIKLSEPTLLFRHRQAMEDPRDGLTLFGPLDEGKPYGIRAGVIGTRDGIRRFKNWLERIQGPISNDPPERARPTFPGFEAIFRIPWNPQPTLEMQISDEELNRYIFLDDKYQRVYKAVEMYSKRIIEAISQEESEVDVWFVIVPDNVYKYCRPKSYVEVDLQIQADSKISRKYAQTLQTQPSIFTEHNIAAIPYYYEVNFHNQLKARILEHNVPTQIIRESTIAHKEFVNRFGEPKRNLDVLQSAIAWHISTAVFYKSGGRPWKIGSIRDGVCYIGLVFKQDERNVDPQSACCAAQMFLDSGDGVVFKGTVGPWYSPERGDFHLSRDAARELVRIAVNSYKEKKGQPPKELFLHGKVRFNDNEWMGFREAIESSTKLVGVRIREENGIKLYRKGSHPVLRGLAYIRDERTAYLWTRGYMPRLQTYPGREVPKPLLIDVCRGDIQIETVLNDIMALTKLNYNACVFADGQPVTLKFANAVGEILTAGPFGKVPPLPFKYYI
jgi:hypothetical protein